MNDFVLSTVLSFSLTFLSTLQSNYLILNDYQRLARFFESMNYFTLIIIINASVHSTEIGLYCTTCAAALVWEYHRHRGKALGSAKVNEWRKSSSVWENGAQIFHKSTIFV